MLLSTHVLDTAQGAPAGALDVRLFKVEGEARTLLASAATDADGRVAAPFGGDLAAGWYELVFAAGAYFARFEQSGFYDEIAIRFRIDAGAGRYHVPLLLAPWGYSTYRGS